MDHLACTWTTEIWVCIYNSQVQMYRTPGFLPAVTEGWLTWAVLPGRQGSGTLHPLGMRSRPPGYACTDQVGSVTSRAAAVNVRGGRVVRAPVMSAVSAGRDFTSGRNRYSRIILGHDRHPTLFHNQFRQKGKKALKEN